LIFGWRMSTASPERRAKLGEVAEWSNALAWKASRGDKPLEGSNPSLSASAARIDRVVIAIVASTALIAVGGVPDLPARQAVPSHFDVPPSHGAVTVTNPTNNAVTNGDFESGKIDGGWFQCGDFTAYTTTQHPHGGSYDEYSGTPSGVGEPLGDSGVCQAITIPVGAVLTAQLYQLSNEPDATFAYQEADLLDDSGNVVINLYKTVNNRAQWLRGTWNLDAYAGRTFWLYFGVHGDGYQKLTTQQFLDDVLVTGSTSPPDEATPHATAGPNARAGSRR
jgi:hypothetical protein